MPKPKTSLVGLHPKLQAWVQTGRVPRHYAFMIQDLRRYGLISQTNFDLLVHETRLSPHRIGVFARQIKQGEPVVSELIRKALKAKKPTVPDYAIRYLLQVKHGRFGYYLRRLRNRYNPPDTLWFGLIRRRIYDTFKDHEIRKTVDDLLQRRNQVVHNLYEAHRRGNPQIKTLLLNTEELYTIRKEMEGLADSL